MLIRVMTVFNYFLNTCTSSKYITTHIASWLRYLNLSMLGKSIMHLLAIQRLATPIP